ncbi:NAD-glutamate dehydrogenase [Nocardioides sp. B-3]|uniref:NAD-glutamate dehydrogenase n=1 Tax=Nocardioides sp. B-3 TaxID=2895565 RepID=UPI0021523AB4|nr:NAD-glutamate dehydrogenase [Nocardioides sp. B-3]
MTDNPVDGVEHRPSRVRCHDDPDPYLVVAADKGTATFSDLANEVAAEYGFWLGDAFASGGSERLRPQGHGHHRPRRPGVGRSASRRDRL